MRLTSHLSSGLWRKDRGIRAGGADSSYGKGAIPAAHVGVVSSAASSSKRFGGWRRRFQAAFSLVEATMGMALVGTTVGALLSGFSTGFFTMQLTRENLRATQIMLEKVETIRLYSWDQIHTPGFIPSSFTNYYDPQAPLGQRGVAYVGTLTITTNAPIGSSYSNDVAQVTVRVEWKTGHLTRSRQFTSYISRYGLQDYIY